MLYLTCTTITSVDLAHYGVSRVKDRVSGDCGTIKCLECVLFRFKSLVEESAAKRRTVKTYDDFFV